MTTQIEELVWHKYPDEKPEEIGAYLTTRRDPNGKLWTTEMGWFGEWSIVDDITAEILSLNDFPVIAWAIRPKGWQE